MVLIDFFTKRIRTKIVILFLFVSIIPLLIIGLIITPMSRKTTEEDAYSKLRAVGFKKEMLSLGDSVKDYVQNYLEKDLHLGEK